MRLVLDQMLDVMVAESIRSLNIDVVRVSDYGMQRADDSEILEWAIGKKRVLITLDSDFGDWAILPLEGHPGVIRVKAKPAHTQNIIEVLLPFLREHSDSDFSGKLVIVSKSNVRWVTTGW